MTLPTIGFVGMTHLGLVSGVCAAEKGFQLVCFDQDKDKISDLNVGQLPVSEPQLDDLLEKNKHRILFTSDLNDLVKCDVVYVAPDIPTDDSGKSDLVPIDKLLNLIFDVARNDAVIVVLSQIPPGFSRKRSRTGKTYYYQVETLIFGRAVERALYPERYIVGCADPEEDFPKSYEIFLKAHDCPILKMRYESAELAKISINMYLVASISTANTLAELCEKIGADWAEIVPALKLDKRIGEHSYLTPGLGIAGGNLERDLATVCKFADEHDTDAGVVRSWIANSQHRKRWAANTLRAALPNDLKDPVIAIWGLAYKENTHSTKNSPSIAAISQLQDFRLKVYDPIVSWCLTWHPNAEITTNPLAALDGADALMIMTPWPQFKEISADQITSKMKGSTVIDPYGVIGIDHYSNLIIYTLGKKAH